MFKRIKNFFAIRFYSPVRYARFCGVKVGEDCMMSIRQWHCEGYLVEIGNHVRIAAGTKFFTHGGITTIRKYYNDPGLDRFGKIKIGDYTSIGENCIINPGVTIGKCCIVGGRVL